MLRTKVKASSVTNLTDARYFAAWEVYWLGFDLDPHSERHVSPTAFEAIREWVDGVEVTGEFNLQSPEEIREAVEVLRLDAVQAGPLIGLETLAELELSVPLIKEVIPEPGRPLEALQDTFSDYAPHVRLFLLDLVKGGWSWEKLQADPKAEADLADLAGQYPVLLALDLPPSAVDAFLEAVPVEGLAVQGGEEEKVGYKSFDELDELFEALEIQV
jgi:phosphoribosylanthranilate isomerase